MKLHLIHIGQQIKQFTDQGQLQVELQSLITCTKAFSAIV